MFPLTYTYILLELFNVFMCVLLCDYWGFVYDFEEHISLAVCSR